MEYTQRIDAVIAELVASRAEVAPEHLPGIPDEDGALFLEHFARLHDRDGSLVWDGSSLTVKRPDLDGSNEQRVSPTGVSGPEGTASPSAAGLGRNAKPSPVDEILSSPVGASILDTKRSGGAVSAWLWLLPLTFLLPGGIVAWWLARETNRTVARLMLATGVVMTIVTVASGAAFRGALEGLSSLVGG